MVLLRWMHLRKLVPLTELLEQVAQSADPTGRKRGVPSSRQAASAAIPTEPATRRAAERPRPHRRPKLAPHRSPTPSRRIAGTGRCRQQPERRAACGDPTRRRRSFYNTVVAQAQRIDVTDDRVTFTFCRRIRTLREQFDAERAVARGGRRASRRTARSSVTSQSRRRRPPARPQRRVRRRRPPAEPPKTKRDLKAEAMSSSTVQAMLDVFPAEIRDVEEMYGA